MKQHLLTLTLLLSIPLWFGCEDLIEYSPYQVIMDGEETKRNDTALVNIVKLSQETFVPFKIALIGDSHTYYDDFEDQIAAINNMDSIDFVIHMGDLTLSGIHREFEWYADIIDNLHRPIITLIGNHDCLSNGEVMYREMFGNYNFTLDYNNCHLVFFDDNIWERNVKDPDFEWLYSNLQNGSHYTHQFVFAHIHPWDGQFSKGNSYLYNQIMEGSNITASIHGHSHTFSYSQHYGKVPYLITGDSTDREVVILEVQQDTILVNRKTI